MKQAQDKFKQAQIRKLETRLAQFILGYEEYFGENIYFAKGATNVSKLWFNVVYALIKSRD